MKLPVLCCALAAACCVGGDGRAAQAANEQAERDRIAAERTAVAQAFDARERACRTRFAVNDCVNDAQRERREALGRLRQQEILLDEAERKQRAAERIKSIREQVSRDDARRRREAANRAAAAAERLHVEPPAAPRTAPRVDGAPAEVRTPRRGDEASRAKAQRKRDAYERRRAEAQAHREAVQRRNAERTAQGRRAKPLPPVASSP